jgi:hypothetical protein
MKKVFLAVSMVLGGSLTVFADVESGPKAGEAIGELKVFAILGPIEKKEVDYAKERKDEPTVYIFVQAEKFDRPAFRFIKTLDSKLGDVDKAKAVAIWLGDDTDANKAFIERAKNSLAFDNTAVTVFPGEKSGPNGWGINTDAHLTVIIAKDGKVVKSFAYETVNETDVKSVEESLKKAVK